MTEAQELLFAQRILASAHQMAWIACHPDDVDAGTAAILMRALELTTPDKSHADRTAMFFVHGKDDPETYAKFIESLTDEQRARLCQIST